MIVRPPIIQFLKNQSNKIPFCIVISRSFSNSPFKNIEQAPADKILGLNEDFKADKSKIKVNLTVGAYRDKFGKPVVLESVRKAEKLIYDKRLDHEYASISGIPDYIKKSIEFVYGRNSKALINNEIAAVQTLSGTGACRLGAEFLHFIGVREIYLPDPTWSNHINIFKQANITPKQYTYYDKTISNFNFNKMIEDITKLPKSSWILLHACAHNPTGYDPTSEQWKILSKVILEHKHYTFFDSAYQGFASGDSEYDAYSVRLFVEEGHNILLSQSFAKNFGLYGERIGTFSIVCSNSNETEIVNSQLRRLARAIYSNPPIYGARIINEILSSDELRNQWKVECKEMADRIIAMRQLLKDQLVKFGTKRDWSHITTQIGMFSFLGLTKEQVLRLRQEFHIYCTDDSRISIAGVNESNVEYIAKSIVSVE